MIESQGKSWRRYLDRCERIMADAQRAGCEEEIHSHFVNALLAPCFHPDGIPDAAPRTDILLVWDAEKEKDLPWMR